MPDNEDRVDVENELQADPVPLSIQPRKVRLSSVSSHLLAPLHVMIQVEPCKPADSIMRRVQARNP